MRHLIAAVAAFLVLALMLGAVPAAAKDLPAAGLSNMDVVNWLKSHGLKAAIKHDELAKMDYVASAANNLKFNIYLYACDHGACRSVQYSANWTGMSTVPVTQINDWNNKKRYIRAYLTPGGAIFGEYDVDIGPGGTWEQLNYSLERWETMLGQLDTFLRS
jgi:hypothetical protein